MIVVCGRVLIRCLPLRRTSPKFNFSSKSTSREGLGHIKAQRQIYDSTAKRPNKVCDPYGQGGKPLSAAEAESHKVTIHNAWRIVTTKMEDKTKDDAVLAAPPDKLVREFRHSDFLTGAKFLEKIAAVAVVNNHFPTLELDRVIVQKQWRTISRISCRTKVLEGLSTNDFFLAMVSSLGCSCICMLILGFLSTVDDMACFHQPDFDSQLIDVETNRPELKEL